MMLMLVVIVLAVVLIILSKIKFLHTDCKSKVCLVGKTALVTGGNSGIGYQVVLGLLQRGCRVIIADKVKDQNLLENIYKETQSRNVVFEYVDLSSFKSTRELASNIKKSEERLDILVHNAGISKEVLETTNDGLDTVLQVNYFSAFLLTHLLVDLLKKSKGRIISTCSITCLIHNLSLKKLKPIIESTNGLFQYPNSKVCLLIAGDLFAEKLKTSGITSNSYHPGLVYTNIFTCSHLSGMSLIKFTLQMLNILAFLVGKSAEQGAQTAIHLACASEVEHITGEFFFETKKTFKPKLAWDRKFGQALWEITEKVVNLKPNEKI